MSESTPIIVPDMLGGNPARLIDQTLLKPRTCIQEVEQLCEEAVEWGFYAVCIPPLFVSRAVACLYGSEVRVVSVVGFPCGYDTTACKVQQAAELVSQGCAEIDMVIRLGAALDGTLDEVEEDIAQVVLATCGARLKVIIECCYLTPAQKVALTRTVMRAGAAYVKTSTGFGSSGASEGDVRLLAETAAGKIGIKAAGGIRNLADLRLMQRAGATRIGTSSGAVIMQQWVAGQ
ncbi:MAG: deoxyribose-phosphate aldolase [Geopsychrobacter sp.]|nr:deoxyribose-phosphate aldolase [Geopsychrobacter sp.]